MLDNTGMSCENYDRTLHGWATGGTADNFVSLGAAGAVYSAAYGVTGRNTLIDSYGWFISNDTYQAGCNNIPLPVTFGNIQAWIKDKILTIDWSSIHETNNHHFEIEVSTDGSAFTKVATVASKAPGGNSTTALQYTFNLGLSDAPELIGMLLLGYILVGIRRSRYIHGLTMV